MDLIMTAFCVITILVIFFAGCDNTSKEEEIVDTLLLVARNFLQFGRLASVMRQYVSLPLHHDCIRMPFYSRTLAHRPLRIVRARTRIIPPRPSSNLPSSVR